jgi:hypothetical protein
MSGRTSDRCATAPTPITPSVEEYLLDSVYSLFYHIRKNRTTASELDAFFADIFQTLCLISMPFGDLNEGPEAYVRYNLERKSYCVTRDIYGYVRFRAKNPTVAIFELRLSYLVTA